MSLLLKTRMMSLTLLMGLLLVTSGGQVEEIEDYRYSQETAKVLIARKAALKLRIAEAMFKDLSRRRMKMRKRGIE
jgi:hypothetical protein